MSDDKQRIIFFDLETTGLGTSPFGGAGVAGLGPNDVDQILSAYFIVTDGNGRVVERMGVALGSRGDIVPKAEALAINGMNVAGRKGLSEHDAASVVRDLFVRHGGINAMVAGHNSDIFDLPRLRSLLSRNGVDPAVIPRISIDTRIEATKAWTSSQKPEHGRQLDSKSESDSMTLASACRRHGVAFSSDAAHDARYDIEATVGLWKALGRPKNSRHQTFDSPYALENLAGKTVKLDVFEFGAGFKLTYKKKNLTVIGCGTGPIDTAMGPKHLTSTYMINNDAIDSAFAETMNAYVEAKSALARSTGAEADRAAVSFETNRDLLVKMLKKSGVVEKRGFHSSVQYYQGDDAVSPSGLYTSKIVAGLSVQEELASLVRDTMLQDAIDEERIKASSQYAEFQKSFRGLETLSDESVAASLEIASSANLLCVPRMADALADLHKADRRRFMIPIAWHHGFGFAGLLLDASEKFGARNGLSGFEDERLSLIRRQLPESIPVTVSFDVADLFPGPKEQMSLKATIQSLMVTSDGNRILLTAMAKDSSTTTYSIPYPVSKDVTRNLTGTYIAEALSAMPLAINSTGSQKIAQFIMQSTPADPDRTIGTYIAKLQGQLAFENSKPEDQQKVKLINALSVTLGILGDGHDHLAASVKSVDFQPIDDHQLQYREVVEGELSADESMLSSYDELRSDFLDATVRKTLTVTTLTPHEPSVAGQTSDVSTRHVAHTFRCKVCHRYVKSLSSVEGIGPKCATKLRQFIENPMSVTSSGEATRSIADIEDQFKTEGDARRYPIMLVKTESETFVADIVDKMEDGSFLMINLSRLAKMAGTKKKYTKTSSTSIKVEKNFVGDLGVVVGDSDMVVLKVFGEA